MFDVDTFHPRHGNGLKGNLAALVAYGDP